MAPKPSPRKRRTHSSKSEEEKIKQLNWRCNEGNAQVIKLLVNYQKKLGDKKEIDVSKHLVSCSLNFHLIWNFYTQTDCGKKMLDGIAAKLNCKVSLPTDELKKFFIVQVSDVEFEEKSDVKSYVDGVIDSAYTSAQESLSTDSIRVDCGIQDDVREKLKERKQLNSAWIEFINEGTQVTIYTVCHKEHKQSVVQIITELAEDATKSFNSQIEMVTADFMWQRVMARFEYLKEIGSKFPNTEIIQDENVNAFQLKGRRDEVRVAAGYLEKLLKTAQNEVHVKVFSSGYEFEIFTYPEMCDYIDESFPKLPLVWIPNHLTKKIHLFSRDQKYFKGIDKLIEGCVNERFYPLSEGYSKLPFEKIHLLEELKKTYKGRIVIHPADSPTGLLVTVADEILKRVDVEVWKIISSETGEVHPETPVPETYDKGGHPGYYPELSATNPEIKMSGLSVEKVQVSDNNITKTFQVKDKILFRKLCKENMVELNQVAKEHCVMLCQLESPGSRVGFELKGPEKEVQHVFEILTERIQAVKQQMQLQNVNSGMFASTEKAEQAPSPGTAEMSEDSKVSGLQVPMTMEKVPKPSTETARIYLEMIGDASNTSLKTSDTVQERSQQFKTMAGKETRARHSDSQSSNIFTGSLDIIVYIECRIEVAEDVLNSIKITYGQQGIDSLISDLDQLAKVDIHDGRILVLCDYKDVDNVQKCVRNHYNKAKEERKIKEENKHLIHGGNENIKEWLHFAYGHTSWSKNLQLEGGKLYLTGTLQMKKEVEKAVRSMNYWYQEEFTLSSEEQQKADEVVAVVKSELPTIFIKQTKETMIVLSDNRDNFERANFKVKVALGRIKITARGRRHRDPLPYGVSYSGLSKDDKMDAETY